MGLHARLFVFSLETNNFTHCLTSRKSLSKHNRPTFFAGLVAGVFHSVDFDAFFIE